MTYTVKHFETILNIKQEVLSKFKNSLFGYGSYYHAERTQHLTKPHYITIESDSTVCGFGAGYFDCADAPYGFEHKRFWSKVRSATDLKGIRILDIRIPIRYRAGVIADTMESYIYLLQEFIRYASTQNLNVLAVSFVTEDMNALREALKNLNFTEVSVNESFRIKTDYDNYEAFLAHQTKTVQRQYRKDHRAFRKSGLKIVSSDSFYRDKLDAEITLKAIVSLHEASSRKYGEKIFEFDKAILESWFENVKPSNVVMAVTNDGIPVAFWLSTFDDVCFHALRSGQDYSVSQGSSAYFELGFRYIVQKAINLRCNYIDYSTESKNAKELRGAYGVKAFNYYYSPDPEITSSMVLNEVNL